MVRPLRLLRRSIRVATSFIANALAPISPVPVVRIPPVLVSGTLGDRDSGRRRLSVPSEEFVYLFVFDFHSHMERKNPLALIDAFTRAFAPSEPVRLVIKCVNADSDREGFAAMSARARGYPDRLPRRVLAVAGLCATRRPLCDAYVSLHRSEGTGLTITDAMALGKPVIATSWSGNMDFMNVSNNFPVRYELVELQKNVGPYRAGEIWAISGRARGRVDAPRLRRSRGGWSSWSGSQTRDRGELFRGEGG